MTPVDNILKINVVIFCFEGITTWFPASIRQENQINIVYFLKVSKLFYVVLHNENVFNILGIINFATHIFSYEKEIPQRKCGGHINIFSLIITQAKY